MKRIAAIAAVLALAAPAASAMPAHPLASAYKAAVKYWRPRGPLPCHRVQVVVGTPVGSGVGKEVAGPGYETMATAPLLHEPVETCTITLSPALTELMPWHELCDALVHEVGHLYGESDRQTNPASITYPVVEPGSPNYNSVPEC